MENLKEKFESLSIQYINICIDEILVADNNLSELQIANSRKIICDRIINLVKKDGIDFTIGFLEERVNDPPTA